jgi:hypothetical protein
MAKGGHLEVPARNNSRGVPFAQKTADPCLYRGEFSEPIGLSTNSYPRIAMRKDCQVSKYHF